jgi:Asp-tRNA(Asn)/Glu-tRNA(Gln) amidotransferase A subunit family amidase
LRISVSEYFPERKNGAKQNDYKYKRVRSTKTHSHELEIILSRAEIGSHAKETMTELHYFSLATIAQKIRDKEVTPQEVAQHHLQRIEKLQPKLNALAHVDSQGLMRYAHAAGEALLRNREGIGPLHGVPLTVKSCLDVAGWPCAAGSLLRKDYRPSQDAVLVQRLRAAGAVLLGNTTTPEFLMAYETDNRVTGKTSNPSNARFSSGGSSGGEAAAIASGFLRDLRAEAHAGADSDQRTLSG